MYGLVWCSNYEKELQAIEVKSVPQKLRLKSNDLGGLFLFMGSLMFILFVPLFLIFAEYGCVIAVILLILSMFAFSYFQHCKFLAKTAQLRGRHKRFFASFSKIDKLVLEEMEEDEYDDTISLLSNIPIVRLEVREFKLEDNVL